LRHAARRDVIASLPSNGAAPASPAARRGQTFPRAARLVRKSEFDAVYSTGQRRSNAHFTVFVRANELPLSRFGFSIKKELGDAVVRNHMRRRLREMVRCHREEIPPGWDIVIHPKRSIAKEPFAALAAELLRLLKSP